jgi:hypothetical protein
MNAEAANTFNKIIYYSKELIPVKRFLSFCLPSWGLSWAWSEYVRVLIILLDRGRRQWTKVMLEHFYLHFKLLRRSVTLVRRVLRILFNDGYYLCSVSYCNINQQDNLLCKKKHAIKV